MHLSDQNIFSPFCMQCILNGIVKHDVLFSQFQQHGVIKELVNGDIFTETL